MAAKKKAAKKTTLKPILPTEKVSGFATAQVAKKRSGQVPAGKVRLSVNLAVDTHKRLKQASLKESYERGETVSMADLVAELVEKHL